MQAGTDPAEEDACHQVFHPRRGQARQPHGRADGQLEPAIVSGPLALSGHFKTGQRWSPQKPANGMARDGVVLPL